MLCSSLQRRSASWSDGKESLALWLHAVFAICLYHGDVFRHLVSIGIYEIFHKSEWKWGAKRHHHDINMWQIPMFSPKRTSPWTWKLMKTLGRFPGRLEIYVHVPGSKIQTWLVNHCCWVNLVCLSISLVNISSKEVSWRKLRVTDCHILTSPEIVVSSWSLKAHVNWAQWSLG